MEYLTQLLGDSNPEIPAFVDAVGRFQRGEPFETSAQYEISRDVQNMAIEESTETLPPAVEPPATSSNKKHLQLSQSKSRQNQKHNKSRVPPPKIKSKLKEPTEGSSSIASVGHNKEHMQGADGLDRQAKSKAAEKAKTIVKSRPLRGKATTICGCYGTHHDPLTNCLYCGRISCVEEGYSFCAFCGYMVEEVRDDGKEYVTPALHDCYIIGHCLMPMAAALTDCMYISHNFFFMIVMAMIQIGRARRDCSGLIATLPGGRKSLTTRQTSWLLPLG